MTVRVGKQYEVCQWWSREKFHSTQALVLYPTFVRASFCLREADQVKQKRSRDSDTKAHRSSELV